jgi:hypothetical protein
MMTSRSASFVLVCSTECAVLRSSARWWKWTSNNNISTSHAKGCDEKNKQTCALAMGCGHSPCYVLNHTTEFYTLTFHSAQYHKSESHNNKPLCRRHTKSTFHFAFISTNLNTHLQFGMSGPHSTSSTTLSHLKRS